jgi:hypothetical protein
MQSAALAVMPDHFPNSHCTSRSKRTYRQDMQRVRIETAHSLTRWLSSQNNVFCLFSSALRVISAPPPHRRRAADYAHRRICVSLSLAALYLFCTHGVALWLRAVVINGESGINYTAEYVPCNNHEPTRSAQSAAYRPRVHALKTERRARTRSHRPRTHTRPYMYARCEIFGW